MTDIVPHAVIVPPTYAEVCALARGKGIGEQRALEQLVKRRAEIIAAEESDPYRFGWEPGIWKVCYALLGLDFCDKPFLDEIEARFGWTWDEWAEAMRKTLGFREPLLMLLVLGMNRSGKSDFGAKTGQRVLNSGDRKVVRAFYMGSEDSKEIQQARYWNYMPKEQKINVGSQTVYIKYKQKQGFSDASFINTRLSKCHFSNYTQEKRAVIEGKEFDFVNPDELVPPDWIETILYRLATKGGTGLTTFTPVDGYTPTVKMFCDSAKCTRESVAYMLPADGGERDPARTLGLTAEQYDELWAADKKPVRAARAPQCVPEDVHGWLEAAGYGDKKRDVYRPFGFGLSQPAVPEGRKFKNIERVLKSHNPQLGVVYFHCENPYGNPKNVIKTAMNMKNAESEIRIRVYGKADRSRSCVFARFSIKHHVVKDEVVPAGGTNYMMCDPASGRNFFFTWIRALREGEFVYREWPGGYEIPTVGLPGPWTVPSGKKKGLNDGDRGEAQKNWGFSLLQYKFEMARLERWKDYLKWMRDEGSKMVNVEFPYPKDEMIWDWDERNGAEEAIEDRIVDSRAASSGHVDIQRIVTLYEDLLDVGLSFSLASGSQILDGTARINSALSFDMDEKGSFFNKPKLLIAEGCANTIYSLENWMNVDGQKAACKEPIDNLRYYYTGDTGYEGEQTNEGRDGFFYGRGRSSGYEDRDFGLRRPGHCGVPRAGEREEDGDVGFEGM